MSSALTHLQAARTRSNLHIAGGTLVERLLFDGRVVVGVEVSGGPGGRRTVASKRVIVCAGAINTPALLMRSGIGDRALVSDLGIKPVAHLPGVGAHLVDHPAVMMWMVPRDASTAGGAAHAQHQVMARAASTPGGAPDLNLSFLGDFPTSNIPMLASMLGSPTANALSVMLSRPRSQGRVLLRDPSASVDPVVELNLGADAHDVDRLMAGVRMAWQLIQREPLQAITRSVFMWQENLLRSDTMLRNAVHRMLSGTWHAVGTARMGPAGDPMAVVDGHFRVHQLEGLHIVDASVMPAIPSTPTNLTCMMLAERAAAWLRGAAQPT
jgi:choline dehydrogenase